MSSTPKRRQPVPAEAFDHGDARRYRRGCTCRTCRDAAVAEARRWKYLRDTGRSGIVAANKVIAHIWRLRAAGMTDREILTQAELSPPHLYQIIRLGGTVRHTTATRILSIPVPESCGPSRNGAHVPILGTVRRLQTFNAEGWPCKELDRRLDTGCGYTAYLLRAGGDTVRLSTADNIRHAYRDLIELLPEENGVTAVNAKQTRARAAAKEWARAAYWDEGDFDNPDFAPAVSDDGLNMHQLGALRRAEIEHLITFNLSHADIAARLGMAEGYVRDIAREITTGQRRVRAAEGPAASPYLGAAA
jgi:DNA-binding CsgD family transcriptional regulator